MNIHLTRKTLEDRFGAKFNEPELFQPSFYYSAFERPALPVIRTENAQTIAMVHWGLIPFWVKDARAANEIRLKTVNARMESLREKPSFRSAVKSKRCLVLCKGFYEWEHRGNEKIPYYIYLEKEAPMALAGIYDDWTDPESGEIFQTFSIVTTAANQMMARIHNSKKRMPVILDPEVEKKWIDPDLDATGAMEHLKPVSEDAMRAHTISKLISRRGVEKNVPELVKHYPYDSETLPFA